MKNFIKNIKYLVIRFSLISKIERDLLFEAFFLCYVFYIVTKILPLKYYLSLLPNNRTCKNFSREEKIEKIRLIRKTLRRVNRFNFFEFNCLTKSIVFKILLNKLGVGSNIVFSVKMIDKKMLAHACVRVNNKTVYLRRLNFTDVFSI